MASPPPPLRPRLLGPERTRRLEVLLASLPLDFAPAPDLVADLDSRVLVPSVIATLCACTPSSDEMERMRDFISHSVPNAFDRMCTAEQFVLIASFVPHFAFRLQALDAIMTFDPQVRQLALTYNEIIHVAKEITTVAAEHEASTVLDAARGGVASSSLDQVDCTTRVAVKWSTLQAERTALEQQPRLIHNKWKLIYTASADTKSDDAGSPDTPIPQLDPRMGELCHAFLGHTARRIAALRKLSTQATASLKSLGVVGVGAFQTLIDRLEPLDATPALAPSTHPAPPIFDLDTWLATWHAEEAAERARRAKLEQVEQAAHASEQAAVRTEAAPPASRKPLPSSTSSEVVSRTPSKTRSIGARIGSPDATASMDCRARAVEYAAAVAKKNVPPSVSEILARRERTLLRQFHAPFALQSCTIEEGLEEPSLLRPFSATDFVAATSAAAIARYSSPLAPSTTALNDWRDVDLTNIFPRAASLLTATEIDAPASVTPSAASKSLLRAPQSLSPLRANLTNQRHSPAQGQASPLPRFSRTAASGWSRPLSPADSQHPAGSLPCPSSSSPPPPLEAGALSSLGSSTLTVPPFVCLTLVAGDPARSLVLTTTPSSGRKKQAPRVAHPPRS